MALPLLLSFAVVLAVGYLVVRRIAIRRWTASFPRVGINPGLFGFRLQEAKSEFLHHSRRLLNEGYGRYKDTPFIVQTSDMERLILPTKYLLELQHTPESVLSHQASMVERHLGEYTGMDCVKGTHLHIDVSRVILTNNLPRLFDGMKDEVDSALRRNVEAETPSDFHTINTFMAIFDIVTRVTSRVFLPEPICHDEEWLRTAKGYTGDVFALSMNLRTYIGPLRPIVYPFLATTKKLREVIATAKRLLEPTIIARREDPPKEKAVDIMQSLSDAAKGPFTEPEKIVRVILFLVMAATHTSTSAVVNALFDLCSMPAVMEDLKREVADTIREEGGWSLTALRRMKKLDSFLTESARSTPAGLIGFNRKTLKPIKMSDGVVLPANIIVGAATDPLTHDPERYANPEVFDHLRFYNNPKPTKDANDEQFTTLSIDSLAFGFGRLACPGRWYASTQVKLILATLLLDYDVQFPEGQVTRPPSMFSDERVIPDRTQALRVRRR